MRLTDGEAIAMSKPQTWRKGSEKMRPALSPGAVSDSPTVLIVDDERSILSLCCDLAADCGWQAKTASTTDEALQILRNIHIDCLITDIRVPSGGIELIKNVRTIFPMTKIYVLSQYGDVRTAVKVIQLGAKDFITKPFIIEDFQNVLKLCSQPQNRRAFERSGRKLNDFSDVPGLGVAFYDSHHRCLAVNEALAGTGFPLQQNPVIPPDEKPCPHHSHAETSAQAQNRVAPSLTHRETETLRYLAEGKCNKEIAHALALSPKTIDTYRQRVMSKLGLHSQSDLIRYAIRGGLVKP